MGIPMDEVESELGLAYLFDSRDSFSLFLQDLCPSQATILPYGPDSSYGRSLGALHEALGGLVNGLAVASPHGFPTGCNHPLLTAPIFLMKKV